MSTFALTNQQVALVSEFLDPEFISRLYRSANAERIAKAYRTFDQAPKAFWKRLDDEKDLQGALSSASTFLCIKRRELARIAIAVHVFATPEAEDTNHGPGSTGPCSLSADEAKKCSEVALRYGEQLKTLVGMGFGETESRRLLERSATLKLYYVYNAGLTRCVAITSAFIACVC